MTTTTPRRLWPVEEMRRALQALEDGLFRDGRAPDRPGPSGGSGREVWVPDGPVLPVVGALGQAGATVLSVALAEGAGQGRVVECSPQSATGLAAAAQAEMGTSGQWSLGRRGPVVLARTTTVHGPDQVPVPGPGSGPTVLDAGFELGTLLGGPGWVADQVRRAHRVVVVTQATVPGLRRLEVAVELLGGTERVVAVVVGPPRRRWPGPVAVALGPAGRVLVRDGRLLGVPVDRELATRGMDASPLPNPVLRAAQDVLACVQADERSSR